jgi:hypothetical protein
MSNIAIHPTTATNPTLLRYLQASTNRIAVPTPGQNYAILVPKTPKVVPITNKKVPSRTWLKAIGERALSARK